MGQIRKYDNESLLVDIANKIYSILTMSVNHFCAIWQDWHLTLILVMWRIW